MRILGNYLMWLPSCTFASLKQREEERKTEELAQQQLDGQAVEVQWG